MDETETEMPTPLAEGFRAVAWRGAAGYPRVARSADGRWWWVDPAGRPGWVRAVNGVDLTPSAAEVGRRLEAWGFNAVGAGSAPAWLAAGWSGVVNAGFRRAGAPSVRLGGVSLPDVFATRWPEDCAAHAGQLATVWGPRRQVLGYLLDDDLQWGGTGEAEGAVPARPTLLQVCLSLEPANAAFHAAWEFVLAPYGGDWAALARSWAWPAGLPRGGLREWTREDRVLATAGFLQDHRRFLREYARRYFAATTAALRREDPHHLILGARAVGATPEPVRAEMTPVVDVAWCSARSALAGEVFAGEGPVWVDDFCWADPTCRDATAAELSEVERMLVGGRAALARLLAHPRVVAYAWATWRGGPGRQEGGWPGGLVDDADEPVRVHVEPLTALHGTLVEPLNFAEGR
jgi:hypothetical protein